MNYLIKETLVECSNEERLKDDIPYVAILSNQEWLEQKDSFTMGIDMDVCPEIDTTKAEVNYDSLTGSFSIPDRTNLSEGKNFEFAFALDEKGVVFIDESGFALRIIEHIIKNKKWRNPSLERFLFDFLEAIVFNDLKILSGYETRLEVLEKRIINNDTKNIMEELNDIRGDFLDLRMHFEQLVDLSQEFEENENQFFAQENLRFFKLFTSRVERYCDQVLALKEYSIQIRDLYQTQVDLKQNNIMAVLTVITTIFFPLSIITGWYGMNFEFMPELAYKYSYPILGIICVCIIVFEIIFFKKKKWM